MTAPSRAGVAHTGSNGAGPIAIVGIGCRFPGGVDGPESFWRLLSEGVDAIGEIPADRMDVEGLYDPRPATEGRIVSRRGGYLPAIDEFDAAFFGISPRQAERLDPQHRLLLETTWEAFEDAGIDIKAHADRAVGVFVGQWQSDFERRLFADAEGVDFRMTTGSGRYASAGRVSYSFGFNGPSLTIDTACSSSLAAVLVACRSIRAGESTMAVAGGVNVILEPHITIAYSQSRMMAPDGWCKFGDASADGYVRSEGCGMVLLRPLADALAAGDRIYGVIRGGALNNDGRGSGSFGTPSREGQRALLQRAYADAGIAPARARYVEAHGAGTPAGDPVEFDALHSALRGDADGRPPLLVGSVKTNIGHTEGAASVAALIKVALSLHHGAIPATLHLENPSPAIPWSALAVEVPTTLRPWPAGEGPRVAGVSGFGISGSNGHVVVEEAPARASATSAERPTATGPFALPLSARSPEALRALANRYARVLDAPDAPQLRDVCLSAARLRTALPLRAVFVADDAASLIDRLDRFAAGEDEAANSVGHAPEQLRRRVAFVFPGQGPQWIGMGRELLERDAAFREAIDACERALTPYVDWSLREQLALDASSPRSRMDDIAVIQPVLVAVEIALAALWRSRGIEPVAVIGHSMGEVGAAHVAGALSLDDAMRIICARSALMRRTSGRGAMGLIALSPAEVETRLAPWSGRLSVAVHNAPQSTVVSGDPHALRELLASVEADGVFCRQVKVDVASHSAQMEPLVPELVTTLAGVSPRATTIDMYSTVTAGRIDGPALDAAYWGRNLRDRVRFSSAVEAMLADGIDTVVELSPHPALVGPVAQVAAAAQRDVVVSGSLRREEPEAAAVLGAAGTLWAGGYDVPWATVAPGTFERVALPTYPWQKHRYWHPAAELRASGTVRSTVKPPDETSLGWLYRLRWEKAPLSPTPANVAGAMTVLVAGDDRDELSKVAAAFSARGARVDLTAGPDASTALERFAAASTDDATARIIVHLAPRGDRAAYLPVARAQEVLQHSWPTAPRLWFVTRGAQAVVDREVRDAWQAALWGSARVVAEEHPELWGGLIDAANGADDAQSVVDALLDGRVENQVAVRDGERFALRLAALENERSATPLPWRTDSAYLITGGLGDIALHIADGLADAGVRRLVLMGRTPLPPRVEWSAVAPESTVGRRVAAIRALESKGVAVHVLIADVSNEAELSAAIETYRAEGWPPIRGVLHAAGTLENRLVGQMDERTFEQVVGPKLRGAIHLDRLFPDADVFVLFSSTGGFLPQPGQANYAAANSGLDAIAEQRRARGAKAMSIAWGVWSATGLVRADAGARNVEEMRRQGVKAFSPAQGVALFSWLMHRSEPFATVLPIDWAVYRRARAGGVPSIFRHQVAGDGSSEAQSSGGDVASQIAQAGSPRERRELVEHSVRAAASRVLKIPAARIETKRAFGSMGLDSLMALELRNRLQELFGRPLPATLLWNYPTLDALSTHLASLWETPAVASANSDLREHEGKTPAGAEVELPFSLDDIVGMSDDDAARALRGNR